MNKNEKKEGKSSKGQWKDGKLSEINRSRGNDNKVPSKGGKSDDVSNKFPNFCRLTTEERLVFFKALNAARKKVEERGVPLRERFGTVHDEYLHFQKEDESEDESITEKSSSSFIDLSVSSFSQPSTCSFGSDNFEELSSSIGEASPKQSLPDPYEAIIRQDTNSIIDLFLEKKKRNASKWGVEWKEKKEKAEQEKKMEESAWPFLTSGTTVKKTDTPRFDALNAEEKTAFFRILEDARNKVLEKNPEKEKEILPLNSIVRMYQGHRLASRICIPKEKPKSLRVKVTLTSGDNQRMEKIQKEKPEVSEPGPEVEEIIKETSLQVLQREESIKIEVQEEKLELIPHSEEKKELISNESNPNISVNSIAECSDSVESIDTKVSAAESKPEETSLKKATSVEVSTTRNTQETMEDRKLKNSTQKDEQLEEMHRKNVQLEENPKKKVASIVKSDIENEINPKEAPKDAPKKAQKERIEKETSRASFFSLDGEGNIVMEIPTREEGKRGTPDDRKHPSENSGRKVKLEENSGKEKIVGLSLQEEEFASEKDQVTEQEEECSDKDLIQERNEGDLTQLRMEEECTKKETETPEEKEEILGEEWEDGDITETEKCESETEQKEEASVEKCESQREGETEEKDKEAQPLYLLAREACESLVASPRIEESGEREPMEETKIEEEATEGFPCPEPWNYATTSAKVMIVEDNVIEKIRKLIYYLEGKAKKDGRSEKEYLKLLVDYVDYLSNILQTLVHKKECQIQLQNTYTAAGARLKFDDTAGVTTDSSMPGKFMPRSVSAQALGADALLAVSQENVKGEKDHGTTFASDSDISLDMVEEVEDVHFLPPTISSKKVISTKIRLLQDLLKHRAEFAEGNTDDFKIIHHPEEEFVPVEKPPTVQLMKEDNEENAQQERNFFKTLVRCFTCGKKKDGEDGIYENLKGEVVRVDVSEKKKDPANATLNQSTMEVLKAAGRKKIIEKYYSRE